MKMREKMLRIPVLRQHPPPPPRAAVLPPLQPPFQRLRHHLHQGHRIARGAVLQRKE